MAVVEPAICVRVLLRRSFHYSRPFVPVPSQYPDRLSRLGKALSEVTEADRQNLERSFGRLEISTLTEFGEALSDATSVMSDGRTFPQSCKAQPGA